MSKIRATLENHFFVLEEIQNHVIVELRQKKKWYECLKDVFKTSRDLKDIELKGRNTRNKQRRYKINSNKNLRIFGKKILKSDKENIVNAFYLKENN